MVNSNQVNKLYHLFEKNIVLNVWQVNQFSNLSVIPSSSNNQLNPALESTLTIVLLHQTVVFA